MTEADDRLRVTYRLLCGEGEDPSDKARGIAYEQTVELPPELVSPELVEKVVGRVEQLRPLEGGRWETVISYAPESHGNDVPQLWNLLFGNISLKSGIRITKIDWPAPLLRALGGPCHGVDGLRRLCGVDGSRPLLCAALKPSGLSSLELADLCRRFAAGGVDLVKDDHGLVDPPDAPFVERVARCQEAVEAANAETGGSTLYLPNVTAAFDELPRRVERALETGCRGVLLSPIPAGVDTLRWIAGQGGLAVLAHPSLSGAFFHDDHGISPEILIGELFRVAGADGVIYPNADGRFPFAVETCAAIHESLRAPLGPIRASFPVLGGGIDVARVPGWIERYGRDTVFLIGGSLYARGDLTRASRDLLETIRSASA